MLHIRACRPANNLRSFSRSSLRYNVESIGSPSSQKEQSNAPQSPQAQPRRETHANVPEESWSAAPAGAPKAQSSDSPRPLDSNTSTYDLGTIKQRIGDWMTLATAAFRQQTDDLRLRADHLTQKTATRFFQLGSQLNRVTGYEQIEVLKQRVVEQGMLHFFPISRKLRVVLPKRLESKLLERPPEKLRQPTTMLSCSARSLSDK